MQTNARRSLFPVQVESGAGRSTLYVPADHPLAARIRGTSGSWLRLRLGRLPLVAMLQRAPAGNDAARLVLGRNVPWPRSVAAPLQMRRLKSGVWHVGPVIGILSRRYRGPIFGPQTALFRRMIREAAGISAAAFTFTPGSLSSGRRRMLGYRPGAGLRWRRVAFPLPDVVYDRAFRSPAVVGTIVRLRRAGVRVFNGRLGSKWRQTRIVRSDPELRPFVPPTRRLRSAGDLSLFLSRYGAVYVKPTGGGMGRGIWRIERLGNSFLVRHTDRRARVHGFRARSVGSIYRSIRRYGGPFIVQSRLQLIRWEGAIADVRVLMQKNISGQWQITGAGVRAGRRAGIVSNLSGGGRSLSLHTVLEHVFPGETERIQEITRQVYTLALQIARRFDRFIASLGELGIDLGIDTQGRIWFLEVNSKTGRRLFHSLEGSTAGQDADRRPMEYAAWLAGFGTPNEEGENDWLPSSS